MQKVPFDDPDECLFIRVKNEHVWGDGVVPAVVEIPDWSTNRERFSAPEDVLTGYPDYTRVGEFQVRDIPERIDADPPANPDDNPPSPWCFWAEHDPLPDNYAHSEVRMRKDGESYVRNKKPNSSTYRKKVRNVLAKMTRVRATDPS
jgi:hypothetical protein